MYYCEWLAWRTILKTKNTQDKYHNPHTEMGGIELFLYEEEIKAEQAQAKLRASETPSNRGPLYHVSDYILEMRCGLFESNRGYITLLSVALMGFLLVMTYLAIHSIAPDFRHLQPIPDHSNLFIWYSSTAICSFAVIVGTWFYWKIGFTISRMEIFTSRHLLVRFNRKDQQVYLHRPASCGGIAILPWEGVICSASDRRRPDTDGYNAPLVLIWPASTTQTLHPEIAIVGRRGNNQSELRNEWEFIRLFMDEGAEGLPRPRLTSHFPWPLQAFTAAFEGVGFAFSKASTVMKLGMILISPAFLFFGMCHWASLMLCWKPRWPKIIREAGLPGKPAPPLKIFADYPPHIQRRLEENAAMWKPRPGRRPQHSPMDTDNIDRIIQQ